MKSKLTTHELFELKRAIRYCIAGHDAGRGGIPQIRKYTGQPYWVHPIEVMGLVKKNVPDATMEMLQAALFHDLVEDTDITLWDIIKEFGEEVAVLVEMLTDVSKPEDGNRRVRKNIDLKHTASASPEAKTIKLCDLISNTRSIVDHDRDFAVTYLREKALLLEVLKEGNQVVYDKAYTIMQESELILMRESLKQ